MASGQIQQRNQEATVYVGNLEERVSDELLWELMLQVGPIVNVHIPKDKISGKHMTYGFVEYRSEDDAEYAIKVLNMIKVGGKSIKVNRVSQDKSTNEVGANVFVGNLDDEVDEKLLYDTFSAFGSVSQTPKIMRDPDVGTSRGYGFVSFDEFEYSDMAIECMNGQYLCNRPIVVQYAFKRDTPGERHGSQAERMLAASSAPLSARFKPNTNFSGGDGDISVVSAGPVANIPGQVYGDLSSVMLSGSAQGINHQAPYGLPFPLANIPQISYPPPQMQMVPNYQTPRTIPTPSNVHFGMAPLSLPLNGIPPPPPPPLPLPLSSVDILSRETAESRSHPPPPPPPPPTPPPPPSHPPP